MNNNPFFESHPGFHRLYIFGSGGFGRELAWLVEQAWGDAVEVVFLVDDASYLCERVNGVEVKLVQDTVAGHGEAFVVAVGDAVLRRRSAKACSAVGLRPATLVHPRVESSRFVSLGEGVVVCAGSILTTNIRFGAHVHVNLDCTIGHDVDIGDFSTLSPGVHISGHVKIGQDVFIGTGASIINGSASSPLVIGDGAVIAAGACVTKSVVAGALVAGVPAVIKRMRSTNL